MKNIFDIVDTLFTVLCIIIVITELVQGNVKYALILMTLVRIESEVKKKAET